MEYFQLIKWNQNFIYCKFTRILKTWVLYLLGLKVCQNNLSTSRKKYETYIIMYLKRNQLVLVRIKLENQHSVC